MKRINIILTIFITLLLAACGTSTPPEPTPDVAAVRTSAASTVVSQFTLTAAAFTPTLPSSSPVTKAPTLELEPTATATATVASITNEDGTPVELCDSLGYNLTTVDVNVPDNTVMNPGQDFIKTWKVKNTGSCPWGAGYVLDYGGYENEMDGQFIALTEVIQPGQEVDVSVQFKAPDEAGIYVSAWTMENPQGVPFPEIVFVKIIVQ